MCNLLFDEECSTTSVTGRRWHVRRWRKGMNKGKPSGNPSVSNSERSERRGTAGAGPEWTDRRPQQTQLHPGGDGGPKQNAGGPDHRGGEPGDDRNP